MTDDWERVDTGAPDPGLMARVRTVAEDSEPLVTAAEFDDLLDPEAVFGSEVLVRRDAPVLKCCLSYPGALISREIISRLRGSIVGVERHRWFVLVFTTLGMAPLEQHLERLLVVRSVDVRPVLGGESFQKGVSVVVGRIGDVPIFLVPHPPMEVVHPSTACLDCRLRIALDLLRVFPEGQEPLETVFPV